jgi:hypothetical protein
MFLAKILCLKKKQIKGQNKYRLACATMNLRIPILKDERPWCLIGASSTHGMHSFLYSCYKNRSG